MSIVNKLTIKTLLTALLLVMLSTLSSTASAHRLGEGYVFINIGEDGVHGEVTITLRDLDRVLSLDIDGNGVISDEEVSRGRDRVFDYVAENVTISEAEGENVLRLGDLSLQSLDVGRFASISYESEFLDARRDIVVRYSMIFEADPSHRGFLVLQSNAVTGETWEGEGEEVLIFTPGGQERVLPVEGVSAWTGFGDLATVPIDADQTSELQHRLLLSHAAGLGAPAGPVGRPASDGCCREDRPRGPGARTSCGRCRPA